MKGILATVKLLFSWVTIDFKLRNVWSHLKFSCFLGLIATCLYGLSIGVFEIKTELLFVILPTRLHLPLLVTQGILWVSMIFAYNIEKKRKQHE